MLSGRKPLAWLFAAALLSTVMALDAKQAHAQDVSISFLREICFFIPWQDGRHKYGELLREEPRVRGSSVRLRIRNPSWHDDATICIYDNICRAIRFRGRLMPGSQVRIEACANRQRRGSVMILEAFGETLRYDNLRSGTINLPGYRSRR